MARGRASTEKAEPPPALPFVRSPVLRGGAGLLREGKLTINVCGEAQSSGGHARPRAEAIAERFRVAEPPGQPLSVNLPTSLAVLATEDCPLKKVALPSIVGVA